ncbi:MAG: hypothetical protein GEV12_23820 [Micromonosporaceae bacterium]|nr:hypothetical protein [Micromonosporaceae bacterium]
MTDQPRPRAWPTDALRRLERTIAHLAADLHRGERIGSQWDDDAEPPLTREDVYGYLRSMTLSLEQAWEAAEPLERAAGRPTMTAAEATADIADRLRDGEAPRPQPPAEDEAPTSLADLLDGLHIMPLASNSTKVRVDLDDLRDGHGGLIPGPFVVVENHQLYQGGGDDAWETEECLHTPQTARSLARLLDRAAAVADRQVETGRQRQAQPGPRPDGGATPPPERGVGLGM